MEDHLLHELSALDIRGVGEVTGEGGVGVAVELECHTAETLENLINEYTCAAVCRVENDTGLLRTHFDAGYDIIDVSVTNVNLFVGAFLGYFCGKIEKVINLDDVSGLEGLGIAVRKLEAGPTVGVVAGCDHNGTFAFQMILSEIGERRKRETDVEYVDAFFTKCFDSGCRKSGRAGTAVITDNGTVDISALEVFGVSLNNSVNVFVAELFGAYFAADVIFTEHAAELGRVFGIFNHCGDPLSGV
jgi:hypothetical protein